MHFLAVGSKIRIVALSASLGNAKDLNWPQWIAILPLPKYDTRRRNNLNWPQWNLKILDKGEIIINLVLYWKYTFIIITNSSDIKIQYIYTSPTSVSIVFVFFCAVAMENLHHLTGCLGQFPVWRAEFHETIIIFWHVCLVIHPHDVSFPWLCGALAHWTMYSFSDFFFSVCDVYARFYSCRQCWASKCRGL